MYTLKNVKLEGAGEGRVGTVTTFEPTHPLHDFGDGKRIN